MIALQNARKASAALAGRLGQSALQEAGFIETHPIAGAVARLAEINVNNGHADGVRSEGTVKRERMDKTRCRIPRLCDCDRIGKRCTPIQRELHPEYRQSRPQRCL